VLALFLVKVLYPGLTAAETADVVVPRHVVVVDAGAL
jgi:hypothetical protein